MSRTAQILTLLFISWPVNNIHRLLNNIPTKMVHWYPFAPDVAEDIQWHVHNICEAIAYLCIFIGIRLYIGQLRNRRFEIDAIINCIFVIQAIDLIHYLGWHRRSELILTLEALIFIYTTFKILKKAYGQTR